MAGGLSTWIASGRSSAPAVEPAQLLGGVDVGTRLMLAGVSLLAVSPVLRVLALFGLWTRERAWRFVATSALVLILLIVALWVGNS